MHPFIEHNIKNYILIGESGSGKTENALNFACFLAQERFSVSLFDMDQTKPLFRARNFKQELAASGVNCIDSYSFLDSPIVPPGVSSALLDSKQYCVLDVGGNIIGARMLGQFGDYLNDSNTRILYVINSYRSFSDTIERISNLMNNILSVALLDTIKTQIVSNPYIGEETSAEDIRNGHAKVRAFSKHSGIPIAALTVKIELFNAEMEQFAEVPVFPLKKYISYS